MWRFYPFSPSTTVICTAKVTKTTTVRPRVFVSVKPETCRRLPGSRGYYEVYYAAQRGHVRANLDGSLSALCKLTTPGHVRAAPLSVAHEPTRPKKETYKDFAHR